MKVIEWKPIKIWDYLYSVNEKLGFNKSNICMCCKGKNCLWLCLEVCR